MKAVHCSAGIVLLLSTLAHADFPKPKATPMPYAEKRRIDEVCDADGSGSTAAKRASNRAKNNFAAPPPAIPLTFADFERLQQFIDTRPGIFRPKTPDDGYEGFSRSSLENVLFVSVNGNALRIGEGKRVELVALIHSARHANSWPLGGDGESVNCNSDRMNRNDIHIELVEQSGDPLSKRVTAEISPHYRPMVWERFDTHAATAPEVVDVTDINGNKPLAGKPGIVALVGRRVRIYGHLYFDDVHRPCHPNPTPCSNPSRLSTWEVHPVYAIDVEEEGEWVPFHEWAEGR